MVKFSVSDTMAFQLTVFKSSLSGSVGAFLIR